MKALILAAGRGSRMADATTAKPKCLTRLGGRTLLDLQRSALRAGGVPDHGIVTGYLAEQLVQPSLTSFHNPHWQSTNMVQSLLCAEEWLGKETCVVSYSDIFYPPETVRRLVAAPGDIVLAYDPNWLDLWQARFADPLSDAETFRLDPDGRLLDIGARSKSLAEIQGQYMGLLKFTPAGFAEVVKAVGCLPADRAQRLDMTSLLSHLIAADVPIHAVPTAPNWGEVDSPTDLQLYTRWLDEKRLSLG